MELGSHKCTKLKPLFQQIRHKNCCRTKFLWEPSFCYYYCYYYYFLFAPFRKYTNSYCECSFRLSDKWIFYFTVLIFVSLRYPANFRIRLGKLMEKPCQLGVVAEPGASGSTMSEYHGNIYSNCL